MERRRHRTVDSDSLVSSLGLRDGVVSPVFPEVDVVDHGGKVAVQPWEHGGNMGGNLSYRRFPAKLVVGVTDVE